MADITETRDAYLGTTIDDKYRIIEKIGEGGMGTVYRAEHIRMKRPVAIKFLTVNVAQEERQTRLKRFEREAQTASKIDHPHAVTIFDFGSYKEQPYLIMRHVEGETLKDILLREEKLSAGRVLRLLEQVCSAISEAHAVGIVHRDLKPENIMVSRDRHGEDFAVVLDFGIAKLIDAPSADLTQMTQTGSCVGSPKYMSPEQVQAKELHNSSDVYSLGAIAYHLLSGRPPFEAESFIELAVKHVTEPPPPLRGRKSRIKVSAQLEAVLLRALEKDHAKRQQSADEFFAELEHAMTRGRDLKSEARKKVRTSSRRSADSAVFASRILIGLSALAALDAGARAAIDPGNPVSEVLGQVNLAIALIICALGVVIMRRDSRWRGIRYIAASFLIPALCWLIGAAAEQNKMAANAEAAPSAQTETSE